jgi:DeoR/GlpR family transcriptional regulator of sugar metabolism
MINTEHYAVERFNEMVSDLHHEALAEPTTGKRREAILAIAADAGVVRIGDLAARMGVSEHTIRRDLDAMAEAGYLQRIRGGAVLLHKPPEGGAVPYLAEKRRIGAAAAALVAPGETICIDAGSTTLEVARSLPKGISILTNAINIAYELANLSKEVDITLTGGSVVPGTDNRHGLTGPTAIESIKRVGRVSKAIIGSLGVDVDVGLTDRWYYLAEVKRVMIEIADSVILVADASKIGKTYLEHVCDIGSIDVMVTDSRIAPHDVEKLASTGLKVITV